MTDRLTGTFCRLQDGSWGVRIHGKPVVGDIVLVNRRDGQTRTMRITRTLVYFGDSRTTICEAVEYQPPVVETEVSPRRTLSEIGSEAYRRKKGRSSRGGSGEGGVQTASDGRFGESMTDQTTVSEVERKQEILAQACKQTSQELQQRIDRLIDVVLDDKQPEERRSEARFVSGELARILSRRGTCRS